MPEYSLEIQFDDAGLKTLELADQYVTLVKSTGRGRPVAWVSFRPMQHNLVNWTEEYSVYASTTQIQEGAQIFTQSTRPAVGGHTYALQGGRFHDGAPGLPATNYGVHNVDPHFTIRDVPMVTSGLYQGAVVNGSTTASPLNAIAVPYFETAVFTPVERVQIFASSYQDNGLVISRVSSLALTVDLTTHPSQVVHYATGTNQFTPGALA